MILNRFYRVATISAVGSAISTVLIGLAIWGSADNAMDTFFLLNALTVIAAYLATAAIPNRTDSQLVYGIVAVGVIGAVLCAYGSRNASAIVFFLGQVCQSAYFLLLTARTYKTHRLLALAALTTALLSGIIGFVGFALFPRYYRLLRFLGADFILPYVSAENALLPLAYALYLGAAPLFFLLLAHELHRMHNARVENNADRLY